MLMRQGIAIKCLKEKNKTNKQKKDVDIIMYYILN